MSHPARGDQARLIIAQLLCGVGIASGVAVGGLLAEHVTGTTEAAGFAQTAVVIGAGLFAIPLARLAARRGRRWSLSTGFAVGAAGALLILLAVATMQWWLLFLGMMLFGSGTATNLQSRYAATELVGPGQQARAMSVVLWATTVGSVAGPNLSEPGSRLGGAIGINPLSGPYLFSVVSFVLAAVVTCTLRAGGTVRRRPAGPVPAGAWQALRSAVRNPRALAALATIVGGQMMMVAVMVMTPVTMNHNGMSLELVGLVISVHIVGMYAASPLFGWLADRIGPLKIIVIGAALFVVAFVLGAVDATAAQSQMPRVMIALGILGLGWSASIIGGSTLLTQAVSSEIKVPLQGAVDSMMNFGAAGLAALAGPILAWGGFLAVNMMAAVVLLPVVLLVLRAMLRDEQPADDHDRLSSAADALSPSAGAATRDGRG